MMWDLIDLQASLLPMAWMDVPNMMWATHCVSVHSTRKLWCWQTFNLKVLGDVIFAVVATSEFKFVYFMDFWLSKDEEK